MPSKRYRATSRKSYKSKSFPYKRTYKRARTSSYKTSNIRPVVMPSTTILPRTIQTTFRFITRLNLDYDGATGISSIVNLAANSLFDPLATAGTAQPPMFDQLMSFYQKYQVVKCTIKMHCSNTSEIPVVVYSVPVTDLTDTYTEATAAVMPNSKRCIVGSLNGSNSIGRITNTMMTKNILGVADASDLQGTAITNPTRLWYWHFSSVPMLSGLIADYQINMHIEFLFTVLLTDIQVVANS